MINNFSGSGVALVTPFNKDKTVDFDSLKKFITFHIDEGTDFLVVQGTTGESPVLSENEKKAVLSTIIEVNNGQLPIVYGVGGNNTYEVAKKISAVGHGVDGILSVSPYYNKPTQQGIYEHYRCLSEHTDLPIILYNVPGRTSSNISSETTLRLSELNNIVAIKEASGNLEQIMDILRNKDKEFNVISGDDALTYPMMTLGAVGVISVVANAFPRLFKKMIEHLNHGDYLTAKKIHYDLIPITKMFFQEGNPAGVKAALSEFGLMTDNLRLPLINISEHLKIEIVKEIKRIHH